VELGFFGVSYYGGCKTSRKIVVILHTIETLMEDFAHRNSLYFCAFQRCNKAVNYILVQLTESYISEGAG